MGGEALGGETRRGWIGTGAWALVLGSTFVGCALSHAPPTEGEEFERRILRAQCAADLSCPVRAFTTPRDVDRCVELRWHTIPWRRRDAVDEGTAILDEDALEACIDGMACGVIPDICAHVTIGLTPTGGACEDDAVCGPGDFCQRLGGCGVCTPLLLPGEHCERFYTCAPSPDGLPVTCDRRGSETCVAYTRREERSGLGEPCDLQLIEPGRAEWAVCGDDVVCRLPEQICMEPFTPIPDVIEVVTEAGAVCDIGHVCDIGAELGCYGRTCQPISNEEGGTCGGLHQCGPGLHCTWSPGSHCTASPNPDGARCWDDGDCASHRCQWVGTMSSPSLVCLPRVACD